METTQTLKNFCLEHGADRVGVASADAFAEAPVGYAPADRLKGCRSVIVFGCAFPFTALDLPPLDYTAVRNDRRETVDSISKALAAFIKTTGSRAIPLASSSGKWVEGRFRSPLSLKHAAQAAGMGYVGKNYLLANREFGNRLWLGAVLTDLELVPDPPYPEDLCHECGICVEECPSGALSTELFGQKECRRMCYKTRGGKLVELMCWHCRTVCPHGYGIET